jgi:hypothetical protein
MARMETAPTEIRPVPDPSEANPAGPHGPEAAATAERPPEPSFEDKITDFARKHGHGTERPDGTFEPDLTGLSLTLGDGRRYVIRGESTEREALPIAEKVGLPRFSLNRTVFRHDRSGGVKDFGRPTKVGVTKKVGLPRIRMYGGVLTVERNERLVDEHDVPHVLVDVYDGYDNRLQTVSKRRGDLYDYAREHGVKTAGWVGEDGPGVDRSGEFDRSGQGELLIDIKTGKKAPAVFEQVTEQLEAAGITTWEGLTWERGIPEPKNEEERQEKQRKLEEEAERYR